MKHLVLSAGLWKLKNSNDIKSGEKDLTREILMTLVDQGILTTEDCCTYTLATTACTTHAKTAYVDPNGNDETAVFGNPTCPYLTIQAALDAAIAQTGTGETVKILPGIYNLTEPVDYSGFMFGTFDISAGVRIIGEDFSAFVSTTNATNVTFTGLGSIQVDSATGFVIEGGAVPGLTIRNLSLENSGGSVIGGAFEELYLSNCLLTNDGVADSVTSTDVNATVRSVNNCATAAELATLDWRIQALVVDPDLEFA